MHQTIYWHYVEVGENSSLTIFVNDFRYEKAGTFFKHTNKLFFVQHSPEYETSDKNRKVKSDVSYSEECRTKESISVCLKNVPEFSSYSEISSSRKLSLILCSHGKYA